MHLFLPPQGQAERPLLETGTHLGTGNHPGRERVFGKWAAAERREAMTAILPKPLNRSANGPSSAQHDPGLPLPCLLCANRGSQRIREGLVMY